MTIENLIPNSMLDDLCVVEHYQETWETMLENDSESYECFKGIDLDKAEEIENLKELYLIPNLMIGSDYSGCAVTKSNYRSFLREFKGDDDDDDNANFKEANGVLSLYGGYSTYAVAIRLDVLKDNEEMQECLNALEDYPLMDENDLSELEMELQDESWEGCYEHDFKNEIEDGLGIDDVAEIGLDNSDKVYELFNYLAEKNNEYWIIEEGCNAYIDLERVMENFDEHFKSWKQKRIEEKNGQTVLNFEKGETNDSI